MTAFCATDEHSDAIPSTAKQKVLGAALAEELAQMGLHNAHMDEYGYVYAWLPATAGCEGIPCVGLIAHMDTSPDAPGAGVKPRVVRYEGGDLVLNEEKGIVMRAAEFESLAKYKGQELIVTDGTTLLGADDKAGVAEIMSAVEYLLQHPELPHGRIAVGFTPDEEVGQGADHFDVEGFGAAVAYTVDGGELGELEYENFNAANAGVYFHGVNIHPGSAKNKMKNAILIALEFAGMLPPAETPAHTEGYEGFYHLHDMKGSETEAELHYILRDHDRARFEARKEYLGRAADYLNAKYGAGTVELVLRDSYYNMREQIEPHMYLILRARAAMEAGEILYAGKYSAPDYERIYAEGCDLAVESTMIYHTPEVKEQLEELGVPVLVERSSYESHPLGRMEWLKLYGVLLGREDQAQERFRQTLDRLAPVLDQEGTGKTVAFFYITSNGGINVRKPGDYISKLIGMAGGEYVFQDLGGEENALSTMNLQMEAFYAGAKDADLLIYNSAVDGGLSTLDELLEKNEVLAEFKAVQEGNVWCTGQDLFQSSMGLGDLLLDIHTVLTQEDPEPGSLTYLYRLTREG